jgi:hypothetical protein
MSGERPSFLWEEFGRIALVILAAGAVLVVGGLFFRTPPRVLPPKNVCIQYLHQLDDAKEQWALDNKITDTNRVVLRSELFGATNYIFTAPTCPGGGNYTIGRHGEVPRCSIPGHSIP